MKIMNASAWYPPEHVGGTEIYVEGLALQIAQMGFGSCAVIPSLGRMAHQEMRGGVQILSYMVSDEDPGGMSGFRATLNLAKPDIFHLHTWTPACGLEHLLAAHEMGIKTAWTLHVPAPVCLRGTLLFRGSAPCDGEIEIQRCGSCWAESRGLPWLFASLATRIPYSIAKRAGFGARGHAERVRDRLIAATAAADRIVCVSSWLRDVLRLNQFAEKKLVLARQGVNRDIVDMPSSRDTPRHGCRVGFIGRWDAVKGLHVLIDAFRGLPSSLPMSLDIYVRSTPLKTNYEKALLRKISRDPRIRVLQDAPRAELAAALSGFDVLAVPSQCLETGPLVALEAAKAGVPVLGSDIGGVAEWLDGGVTGWKVRFDDVAAWRAALLGLPRQLQCLSKTPIAVRTMHDVARDMVQMYSEMLAESHA